jgi:hypothetical protein
MADEDGDVFADGFLEPGGFDETWVRLDLGTRYVTITATAVEENLDTLSTCTRTISRRVDAITRIYAPSRCYNQRVRPPSMIVACGDGNLQLRSLRWRGWNTAVARARGLALINACLPYCAVGKFHRIRASVRLYSRKRCGNIGRYVYTKLRYRFIGPLPRGVPRRTGAAPFPCRMYDLG